MYATQAMAFAAPLAKELDENKVTPGVLGFIVFAVMAGGVWLLMKSMNRHMGKVNFEEAPAQAPAASARSAKSEPASAAPRGE
ncbi:hypothetical protein [Streptomyces sp. NPDC102264]|uniref:hypothetical protein n=1 Tax=Streptomyces sp. NPDC102264 TaxID=3366149 RepID=UPI0037F95C1C